VIFEALLANFREKPECELRLNGVFSKFTPGLCSWHHDPIKRSCGPQGKKGRTMASNPLIGTWRLVSWENRSVQDGQVSYPLGEDATGYIMYNEDGYMFVAIMAPHRLMFAHDDLLSATKEEEALAEETYVSYCGRYDFLGNTIVHHVELSLFPNWIGGDQERLVDLRGERLTLSTRALLLRGIQQTAHLIWERVSTSKQ
jgi:Lipocalin-like domain